MTDTDNTSKLLAQAEALQATDAFGRSQTINRLFRFLLACSIEGHAPKELEIAEQVFGRSASSFDQDASVRVNIHRLRRKMDEFYAGAGVRHPERLTIPKGSYRLAIKPMATDTAPGEPFPARRADVFPRWVSYRRALESVGAVLMLASVAATSWWVARRADAPLRAARASAIWNPALANGRPIVIIVGDYYIFGHRDADGK